MLWKLAGVVIGLAVVAALLWNTANVRYQACLLERGSTITLGSTSAGLAGGISTELARADGLRGTARVSRGGCSRSLF